MVQHKPELLVAKLFQHQHSQAIQLPKSVRFEGDRVYLKQLGNAVVILPDQSPWQPLIDSTEHFSDDFMENREQPNQQERKDLFD